MERETVIVMETDEVRKRKIPGHHEEINTTCTKECKTIPGGKTSLQCKAHPSIYMFYESQYHRHNLHVYELDSDHLSAHLVAKRQRDFVNGRGYAAYGSKLYAIGGEDTKSGRQLNDVYVFDLAKNHWEKGPSLIAGKTNLVVVVVEGKIYALSGRYFWNDPAYDNSRTLFEVLNLTPKTEESELSWEALPDPPFSHMYESPPVTFHTVVRNTIYFLLHGSSDCVFSFNVDGGTWTDHRRQTHLIAGNIRDYYRVSMNSDVVDDVMYMLDADCLSRGVRFIALNLTENKNKLPKETDMFDAASGRDGLSWGFDCSREGTCSWLPCLYIPLKIKPAGSPCNLLLVSHVGDRRFVVVCSYCTKCKLACGKRVVYSCLLELSGDGKVLSGGFRFPSDHAVILKESYQTMSSRLHVLNAWSQA